MHGNVLAVKRCGFQGTRPHAFRRFRKRARVADATTLKTFEGVRAKRHRLQLGRGARQLLHDVGGVHVVSAQVVRDGVEGVARLIVVVSPLSHLAGELGRRRAVDDEPVRFGDAFCGKLQEDEDEVGEH